MGGDGHGTEEPVLNPWLVLLVGHPQHQLALGALRVDDVIVYLLCLKQNRLESF
jgi:hypothetical protein